MATSTTSVVYALPIRVSDLIAAARVYSKVEPTSLGLSLAVRSLKQRNVIPSWLGAKIPAINRVPVEVWEMIRQELIDLEVREDFGELDESKTLKQLRQESQELLNLGRLARNRRVAFEPRWVDRMEELHDEMMCDFGPEITEKWTEFAGEALKEQDVLASFGLFIPSKRISHSEQHDPKRSDSVVLIAADTSKHKHGSAVPAKLVNEVDRHGINNSGVQSTKLGSGFFDKHNKLNLDSRFNRFCAAYTVTPHHLPKPPKPVTPAAAAGAGGPPAPGAPAPNAAAGGGGGAAAAAANGEDGSGEERAHEEEEMPTPGWMILNELARK